MKIQNIFFSLLSINALLIVAHLTVHWFELNSTINESIVKLFSMDIEYSIPSIFASLLLLSIAVLCVKIWANKKTKPSWHWLGLALVFFYVALDEFFALHENLIEPTQNALGIEGGFLFFAWFIPVLAILSVLVIVFAKFFFKLPKTTKNLLIMAAVLFISGAVGVEMISGAYWEAHDFQNDMTYRLLNALEEGLENTGSITAIFALLRHK